MSAAPVNLCRCSIYSIFSLVDPYVKIYLLHKDQRISKKKTHVKKRTLNPVFNESFVFDLPRTDNGLADVQLEFALLDWDRVTKNEVGGISLYFANFNFLKGAQEAQMLLCLSIILSHYMLPSS